MLENDQGMNNAPPHSKVPYKNREPIRQTSKNKKGSLRVFSPSPSLPPNLERLERVFFPSNFERPALVLPFSMPPILSVQFLERHEADLLRRQRLLPFLREKVVWDVLEMWLVPCSMPQFPVMPQVG